MKLTATFRAKPEPIWHGEVRRLRIKIPEIGRLHCNMQAFRVSRKFGSYANSDIFPALLAREMAILKIPAHLYTDEPLPAGVTWDDSGFLYSVTIHFADYP